MATIQILTPADCAVRDMPLLSDLFTALDEVLAASELDNGHAFVCSEEDMQRLIDAYRRLRPAGPKPNAPTDACEICSQSWSTHPRCGRCTIGLGEGHLEGPGVKLLDGHAYCGDCAIKILERHTHAA